VDIPYVSEQSAAQFAMDMLDKFSRLFQRTLRQLNNHRLAKLKAKKLEAEIRRLSSQPTRSSMQATEVNDDVLGS